MYIIHIILVTCLCIFCIQMILNIFGGDIDIDTDIDADDIISFKGILHFLLGFSVYITVLGEINFINIMGGLISGFIFAFVLYKTYKFIYKLGSSKIREEYSELVYRECEIYTNLGNGKYLAYVSINGAQEKIEVTSLSNNTEIENLSKQEIKEYKEETKTIYIK